MPQATLQDLKGCRVIGVWRQQGDSLEVQRPGGIWQRAEAPWLHEESGLLATGRSLWVPAQQLIPSPAKRRQR